MQLVFPVPIHISVWRFHNIKRQKPSDASPEDYRHQTSHLGSFVALSPLLGYGGLFSRFLSPSNTCRRNREWKPPVWGELSSEKCWEEREKIEAPPSRVVLSESLASLTERRFLESSRRTRVLEAPVFLLLHARGWPWPWTLNDFGACLWRFSVMTQSRSNATPNRHRWQARSVSETISQQATSDNLNT